MTKPTPLTVFQRHRSSAHLRLLSAVPHNHTPEAAPMTTATALRPTVDGAALRHVAGAFPTGVTVVTGRHAGEDIGVTVSSFTSVSLEPALVSISLVRGAASLDAMQIGDELAINILGETHGLLARQFARHGEDRFAGVEITRSESGLALLTDTAGYLIGEVAQLVEAGDHVIVLIAVHEVHRGTEPPLLYHSSRLGPFSHHL